MDFNAFKDWALLGILSLGLTGFAYILWELKKSVDLLNIQIAVIIQRTDGHEERIKKLEGAHD